MADSRIASDRRMGPPGSENWHAMLDGAETILREEGHAALTSRRIAERIGVKQRLVYYYFRTMDDLVVELFRRSASRELARLRAALASGHALREIWETTIGSTDSRLIAEFMALANRIDALRSEVIRFIEESREIQVAAIEGALARKGRTSPIPAHGLALMATSIALSLSREEQLGVRSGHAEIAGVIEGFLAALEP
jgi:AcrR family transcriptional regulator